MIELKKNWWQNSRNLDRETVFFFGIVALIPFLYDLHFGEMALDKVFAFKSSVCCVE